jgi:hypothetical protein
MDDKTKLILKVVLVLLGIAAFIRVFPDLRRYAKIEMM